MTKHEGASGEPAGVLKGAIERIRDRSRLMAERAAAERRDAALRDTTLEAADRRLRRAGVAAGLAGFAALSIATVSWASGASPPAKAIALTLAAGGLAFGLGALTRRRSLAANVVGLTGAVGCLFNAWMYVVAGPLFLLGGALMHLSNVRPSANENRISASALPLMIYATYFAIAGLTLLTYCDPR